MEQPGKRCLSTDSASTGAETFDSGTVIFNVSGRHFEVLRQTIEAHPTTLLATLLDDVGTQHSRPIFVDANADRFAHILDWYRFGEMYVSQDCPIPAVLRDARFFLLPEVVRLNGTCHTLQPEARNGTCDAAEAAIIDQWPEFEAYLAQVVSETQRELHAFCERSRTARDTDATDIFGTCLMQDTLAMDKLQKTTFSISKYEDGGYIWCDRENICNRERLQVALAALSKRGFACEVLQVGPGWQPGSGLQLKVGMKNVGCYQEPIRVKLDGVNVKNGQLRVHDQQH